MSTRPPRSAEEVARELEADPAFRARWAEIHARRERLEAESRAAQRPILEDLARHGVEVSSVWDFVNTSEPYHEALPVLMDHFERGGYPSGVMEGLGRALAVGPSIRWWSQLKERYLHPRNEGERIGATVALAACATKEQFDELVELLKLDVGDEQRILFLRPIRRLGRERGWAVVESVVDDPVLGKEARAALKARQK